MNNPGYTFRSQAPARMALFRFIEGWHNPLAVHHNRPVDPGMGGEHRHERIYETIQPFVQTHVGDLGRLGPGVDPGSAAAGPIGKGDRGAGAHAL